MAPMKILLFLVIAICTCGEALHQHHLMQETKITLYHHENPGAFVAGVPGKLWGFYKFGSLYVAEEPMTEGIARHSKQLASLQSVFVTSSLDGSTQQGDSTIIFTNEMYNGSTLEFRGVIRSTDQVMEFPIISGTGKFRFASGYATFDKVQENPLVLRSNITVLHWPFDGVPTKDETASLKIL